MKPGLSVRDSGYVALTALVIRTMHFVFTLSEPLGSWPVIDAKWHHLWAGLVSGGDLSAYAPFFRAPLYPWCLGFWYRLFGIHPSNGAVLSILFSVAAAVAVYWIASRKLSRRWALGVGIVWALWGTDVFYSSTLLITPMYTAILLFAFLCLDSGRGKWGWLLLGAACIARPSALALVPLAFFVWKPGFVQASLFAAPVALVWIFNIASGDPATVISSQGGINLFLGNGPDADGYTAYAPFSEEVSRGEISLPYADNVQQAAAEGLPAGWTGSRISSWWFGRTLEHIWKNPLDASLLSGRKLLYLISPVEIPSNYDPYYFRAYSPILAILLIPGPLAIPFLLVWVLLPGAVMAGKLTRDESVLLLWAALLLLGVLVFFVTARFRLPAVPFILLFLFMRVSRNPRKALLLAPGGLILGILLSLSTGSTARTGGVNMPFFDGLAHAGEGDLAAAKDLFREALSRASLRTDGMDMNRSDAMYNLGVIALRQGLLPEAESWWRATLEYNPGFEPAREALSNLTGLD